MANEERLKKIEEQMSKLKAQKQAILSRERVQERKARTRHLIELGAIAEKSFKLDKNIDKDTWQKIADKIAAAYMNEIHPEAQNQPTENEKTCPKCGSPLRKKHGQYGEFWGCSSHPACTYSEKI